MPGTRKLGRPTDIRMSMLKGLVTYLLENGRLETTVYRAKEVRALTDKMITLGIRLPQRDRHLLLSPRKRLSLSSLTKSLPHMQTVTAATREFSRLVRDAATVPKWPSLSL